MKLKILFPPAHTKLAKRKDPSFFAKMGGKQTHWLFDSHFGLGDSNKENLTIIRNSRNPPAFGFYRRPKATPPFLMGDENDGVWMKIYSLGGDSVELDFVSTVNR